MGSVPYFGKVPAGTQRGFIYTEHNPFCRPCLGVTHSFISSDAMRSHLSPLFASLEKGDLCIFHLGFQHTCKFNSR
jgi:hypothetical protein